MQKEDDELRKQGGRRKTCIVSPQWVLDSIAARRRLPENEYLVVRERNVATLDDLFARKRQHEQTPITIDDDEEEEEEKEEAKAKDKEDKGPSSSSNPLLALMRAHKKSRIDCYTFRFRVEGRDLCKVFLWDAQHFVDVCFLDEELHCS